jgi:hypothetical protein
MVLATILLLFPVPQTGEVTKPATEPAAVVSSDTADGSNAAETLPSMPTPKVDSDGPTVAVTANGETIPGSASTPGAEGYNPSGASSFRLESMKSPFTRPRETPAQRKVWYTLLVTSHAAAGFDAWSTRRAVALGYNEGNPMLRPFANSNAIYVATQVSPAVMDYLGKRMMVSQHGWLRRMWWLPQVAGSGISIGAGVHNVGLIH